MSVNAAGQMDNSISKPIHQFGIDLGGVHYQVRDNIIAPVRWQGFGFNLDFSYSIITKKGLHNIELGIPVAFPNNRYDHSSIVTEINLGYSYLGKIASSERLGQVYIGGMIDWSFNFQYYLNWDDSHMYWLNTYALHPAARWDKTYRDNHKLSMNISFPILALVSRPPEYRYIDQDRLPKAVLSIAHKKMKLKTIPKYLSFVLDCEYMYQLSKKFSIGASYFLNYKTFPEPQTITILSNSLQLKLLFSH